MIFYCVRIQTVHLCTLKDIQVCEGNHLPQFSRGNLYINIGIHVISSSVGRMEHPGV